MLEELFERGGTLVYRGYLDDPQNTDNAWIETCASHFHCPNKLGSLLPLHRGDGDTDMEVWLNVDETNSRFVKLIDTHKKWVRDVAKNPRLVFKEKAQSS